MEAVAIGVSVVAMLAGAIFYNPLRRKMAGVIGVGGAYAVLLGVMLLVMSVAELIGGGEVGADMTEIVMTIIFMIACLGYMVYVMIARCHTMAQRILLPFAACLIGMGFCWRFLMAIFLHIPMESGKVEAKSAFPSAIKASNGDIFTLENDSGDNATYYCAKTGERAQFRDADFAEGYYPSGWHQA